MILDCADFVADVLFGTAADAARAPGLVRSLRDVLQNR
jgi:hypothetical protein